MSPQPGIEHSQLQQVLQEAARVSASDIHIASGDLAWLRAAGEIRSVPGPGRFQQADVESMVRQLLDEKGRQRLQDRGSCDGAFSDPAGRRYRFNVYYCNGRCSVALRLLDERFLELSRLGLPEDLYRVCELRHGLVVVAGPTGSGKSTTLASLIHRINQTRRAHVITIEDPIEFLHHNQMSRISQRQVGSDTDSFAAALVDALRQDPDVILVGEMRDLDTIRTAVTAAETGHLVFATVHAGDCVSAVERMYSVFPGSEQDMIRNLLAGSLRTVIAQHLLLSEKHGEEHASGPAQRVLASEILHVNSAASHLIAADNLPQLHSILEMHRGDGMHTLDSSLAKLWRRGRISERTARGLARNPDMLRELASAI
jgi:twitching motility protein PilT